LKSVTNTREMLQEGYYKVNSLQEFEYNHKHRGTDNRFGLVFEEGHSFHLAQHSHRPRSNPAIASDGMATTTT
jgi:hypothetical protein